MKVCPFTVSYILKILQQNYKYFYLNSFVLPSDFRAFIIVVIFVDLYLILNNKNLKCCCLKLFAVMNDN